MQAGCKCSSVRCYFFVGIYSCRSFVRLSISSSLSSFCVCVLHCMLTIINNEWHSGDFLKYSQTTVRTNVGYWDGHKRVYAPERQKRDCTRTGWWWWWWWWWQGTEVPFKCPFASLSSCLFVPNARHLIWMPSVYKQTTNSLQWRVCE